MTLALSPTVHSVTRATPVYMGIGNDISDMFVKTGRGVIGPFLARPSLPMDRPANAALPVRVLPGDILDIEGIGRYLVGRPGPLEPRLTPA